MVYGSIITLLLLHLSEPVKLFQMNRKRLFSRNENWGRNQGQQLIGRKGTGQRRKI